MITIAEAFTGLYAAWRLFLRDGRAVSLFDNSPAGALKSFYCALIVLPGYALVIAFAHTPAAVEIDWFRFVVVEAIAYVVSWCVWPLVMFYIARALDRSGSYFLYVTAYNWGSGPQMLVLLAVLFLAMSGMVSREVVTIANLMAMVIVLLYHLFIIRVTLKLTFFVCLGLVLAEAMLSQFVIQARDSMLR
jgi:hypothetical protein